MEYKGGKYNVYEQEAKRIYSNFYCIDGSLAYNKGHITPELAKTLSLLCVDELIKNTPIKSIIISFDNLPNHKIKIKSSEYWKDVKDEIQKIKL